MALDGAFLRQLQYELVQDCIGARIDKIAQPSKEELVITLRFKGGSKKLLISAGADSPRIHFTEAKIENPKAPPMFCMLMRKHLSSAKLAEVKQIEMDRILHLIFESTNDLGDPVTITLVVEIMGRHSNCILLDSNNRVIDSAKRIDNQMSSVRPILPGVLYTLPPAQDKLMLTEVSAAQVQERLKQGKDVPLSKALLACLQGLSPLVCREISHCVTAGQDSVVSVLDASDFARLAQQLDTLRHVMASGECQPTALFSAARKPLDFSFIPITQYGTDAESRIYPSCSALLDEFFTRRDLGSRMHARSGDLHRLLGTAVERIGRKLALQQEELATCGDRDKLKMMGDLLSANLYTIKRGDDNTQVQNFYDEDCPTIDIPLDNRLTPAQNAQKYYAEYRKAQTAEKMLTELMESGREEKIYLESVQDLLARATTMAELDQIREELAQGKYLRVVRGRDKSSAKLPPKKYISSDGYTILVGRNNLQNDKLTLKDSHNYDMWFHTKNIPGSHTVVVNSGTDIPTRTLTEAAIIAAVNSKAGDSAQVPVDFTPIKYVKKPAGAKPGKVIYTVYQTAFVTPNEALANALLSP